MTTLAPLTPARAEGDALSPTPGTLQSAGMPVLPAATADASVEDAAPTPAPPASGTAYSAPPPRSTWTVPPRVGYFDGLAPFTETGPDGQPRGLSIDLARLVVQRLGLPEPEFIALPLHAMLDAARAGRVDLVLGLSASREREAYLSFAGPYYEDPMVLVSASPRVAWNLAQLAGQRLAMPSGHFLEPWVRQSDADVRIVHCEVIARCLAMVDDGEADATLGGLMATQALLARAGLDDLRISGVVDPMFNEHSLALVRTRADWLPALQAALASVRDEEMVRLQARWSTLAAAAPEAHNARLWRYLVGAVVVLLLLLASWAGHYLLLRREIRLRREAQSRAEEAQRSAERYLAFLAHEVRNSLHAVRAGISLLRTAGPGGAAHAAATLNALGHSAGSTLTLLNNLLDRHRLQSGGLRLSLRREALAECLREVVAELSPAANEKALSLLVDCEDNLPELMLDALRVQQIVRNLLVNAIKFTAEGEIQVLSRTEPDPSGRPDWCRVVLEVIDSGPGLTPALRRQEFGAPGREQDGATSTADVGSGMGLALSLELARLMGGELVALDRTTQRGARFVVHWPAEKAAGSIDTRPGAVTRVLVVEDDPVYGMLLLHGFAALGIEAVVSDSIGQARLALAGATCDLVLCDQHLADGGPSDLVDSGLLEGGDATARPTLVVMTGHVDGPLPFRLRRMGVRGPLEKAEDIQAMVRKVLDAATLREDVA